MECIFKSLREKKKKHIAFKYQLYKSYFHDYYEQLCWEIIRPLLKF